MQDEKSHAAQSPPTPECQPDCSGSVCPECHGAQTRVARPDERPDVFLALRRWRVCEACGAVFEPESPLIASVLVPIVSAGLALAGVWYYVIASGGEMAEGGVTGFRGGLKLVVGVLAVSGFLVWTLIGLKNAKRTLTHRRRRGRPL